MLIWTGKVKRGWIVGLAGLVILAGVAVIWTGFQPFGKEEDWDAPYPDPTGMETVTDQIAYLACYGWEVNPEPLLVEELLIPEEFDASYDAYLALQSSQGFDLTQYTGERVKRYSYLITNYPTGETGVQIGLLLHGETVVGGEVLSSQMDGFIHSLEMPTTE